MSTEKIEQVLVLFMRLGNSHNVPEIVIFVLWSILPLVLFLRTPRKRLMQRFCWGVVILFFGWLAYGVLSLYEKKQDQCTDAMDERVD